MSVLDTFSMSGKVSVVTGGNRGIGRALATALAEAGSDVVLLVRDGEGSAAAVAELEALGGGALEVTEEEWRSVMDVNVDGLWHCSQAFGRQMVAQRSGVIVNIGSISGQIVNRPQWQPAYNASKAAVHQLTKSLAAEWAPYGVRVNALAPGYIKTEMAPVDEPRFRARWIEDVPMQRAALPSELGPTMVWMCSDASSFMT